MKTGEITTLIYEQYNTRKTTRKAKRTQDVTKKYEKFVSLIYV